MVLLHFLGFNQEGLLLGKICSHQVNKITDSQSSGCREEKKICVHSFISFSKKQRSVRIVGESDVIKCLLTMQFLQSYW